MAVKRFIAGCFAAILILIVAGFIRQNPYFLISDKDVELKLPASFPKPYYSFKDNLPKAAGFLIGRKLFYDNILSKDNSVSCGTCHQRIGAFAHIDHALSHGIYARIGTRNVPSLQNLIWKDDFMWDGRVKDLVQQPLHPITNPIEMDETMEHVVAKLQRDAEYRRAFFKAYRDSAITQQKVLNCLAQFTGLMISANSRYDKYLRKEDTLSVAEKKGLGLFREKCAGCHKEPLFTNNGFMNNGLPPDTSLNDLGKGAVSNRKSDDFKFKVPSLRNIEMTYPYMHDGRFRNLEAVLNHYSTLKTSSGPEKGLLKKAANLSPEEKKNLILFLKTLTDKTFLYDRRFADPAMENRTY